MNLNIIINLNEFIIKEVMENMTEFYKLPKEENKVIITVIR